MEALLSIKEKIDKYQITKFNTEIEELTEMYNLTTNEDDRSLILKEFIALEEKIDEIILNKKFDFKYADENCFLYIQAGAGGVESFDWAEMLLRMYSRFANIKNWQVKEVSMTPGEEAGIKSCTIKITGYRAYGYLKNEIGVHRLVRISPFNSAGKRMTSFASVWVYPEIDNANSVQIEKKDIRIDTFRSSGAGGQHVNTTDSAVRITHFPTGIVVSSQSSRSQHSNKEEAMKMLVSQLVQLELQRQKEHTINTQRIEIEWGNQIRSYVLQPYTMVKDTRSDIKINNATRVLNGDLEEIILSTL